MTITPRVTRDASRTITPHVTRDQRDASFAREGERGRTKTFPPLRAVDSTRERNPAQGGGE